MSTGEVMAVKVGLRPDRPTEEIPQLDGKRAGADGKRRPATKAAEAEQRDKLRDFHIEAETERLGRPVAVSEVMAELREAS